MGINCRCRRGLFNLRIRNRNETKYHLFPNKEPHKNCHQQIEVPPE
jgi:hypothetical protein